MMSAGLTGKLRLLVLLAVAASSLVGAGYAAQPSAAFYDDFNDRAADGWVLGQGDWFVTGGTIYNTLSKFREIFQRSRSVAGGAYCQGNSDIYGWGLNPDLGGRMASYIKGSNYGDFDATVDAVVLSSPTREREMAIIFRAQDFQNFYHLRWYTGHTEGDDHLDLWKYVNGTAILLGYIQVDAMPVGTKAVFKLSAKGNQLRAHVLAKGSGASSTKWLTATDTTYASGLFGFDTYHTAGCFDNVRISL